VPVPRRLSSGQVERVTSNAPPSRSAEKRNPSRRPSSRSVKISSRSCVVGCALTIDVRSSGDSSLKIKLQRILVANTGVIGFLGTIQMVVRSRLAMGVLPGAIGAARPLLIGLEGLDPHDMALASPTA